MSEDGTPITITLRSETLEKVKWADGHLFYYNGLERTIEAIVDEWANRIKMGGE